MNFIAIDVHTCFESDGVTRDSYSLSLSKQDFYEWFFKLASTNNAYDVVFDDDIKISSKIDNDVPLKCKKITMKHKMMTDKNHYLEIVKTRIYYKTRTHKTIGVRL